MAVSRLVVGIGVLGVMLGGCASHEGSDLGVVPDKAPEPTRTSANGPKTVPPSTTTPVRLSETDQRALALQKYNDELAKILLANHAEAQFRDAVRNAASELDSKGFAALIPIYVKYQQAIAATEDKLTALKPPPEAAQLHQTFVDHLDQMDENLDLSISAMRDNNGEEAARLSEARKNLAAQSTEAMKAALVAEKFDVKAFQTQLKLVPVK